jgi:hypothetical protein
MFIPVARLGLSIRGVPHTGNALEHPLVVLISMSHLSCQDRIAFCNSFCSAKRLSLEGSDSESWRWGTGGLPALVPEKGTAMGLLIGINAPRVGVLWSGNG